MKHPLLFMAILMLSLGVHAANGDTFTATTTEGVTVTYKILDESSKSVQVGKGNGEPAISISQTGTVTIPASVTYNGNIYNVTAIGEDAFNDCGSLTSIIIPSNIISIEARAFSWCSKLTSIEIPSSVKTIGTDAFAYCGRLTAVYISDLEAWCNIDFSGPKSNPLYYANHIYKDSSELKRLFIPDGITTIKAYAFYSCYGLTYVELPSTITSIGSYAFYDCLDLNEVYSYIEEPFTYDSDAFSGISSSCDLLVPDGTESAYRNAGWDAFRSVTSMEYGWATNLNKTESSVSNPIYYDLQGRRVSDPTHGIYLLNGKKVLIR